MTTKTRIITVITVGALLAASILVLRNKKVASAAVAPMKSYAMVVSSEPIESKNISLSVPYLAEVKSDKSVILSSRIASRIEEIVTCGNSVHQGDILVKLDVSELDEKRKSLALQMTSVKADLVAKKILLETTEASHKRTKALLDIKGASEEKYDKESSAISGLKAAVVSLENQIGIIGSGMSQIDTAMTYAILKSPIDGIASKCYANVGDISLPGKPLVNVESNTGKYLLVRSADTVQPKALNYKGKVYPLIPMQNTYNGLNEYRAYIETPRSSGERVTISLITYQDTGVKVPLGALLQKEDKTFCFTRNGNYAKAVEVKILARGEEGVVVEGLKEGEQLIVAKPDILLKLLSGVPLVVRGA